MSLRKVVALVLVLFACSATVSILIGRSGGRGQRGTGEQPIGTFAYVTERQLVVMSGQRVIARVDRIFDETNPADNKVVWTNNGNYVALLKDVSLLQEPASREQLIIVNVRTGEVSYRPCPGCYDLSPVQRSGILTISYAASPSSPPSFKIYDVASDGVPRRTSLERVVNPAEYAALLASTRTSVLIGQSGPTLGQDLVLANATGTWHSDLGSYSSNAFMLGAVAEGSTGATARIAVAFRPDPGTCVAQFPIIVFNSDGTSFGTDMSAAFPPGHHLNVDEGLQVNDLWFGPDGHFYATITSWTCDNAKRSENAKEQPYSSARVWRLDGRAWTKNGNQPATMMRQVSTRERIVLAIPDCIGPHLPANPVIACNTGTLYSHIGQATAVLARHVISISSPTPESLASAAPNRVPVLGQLAGYFAQGEGFGTIKPSTIYNGGDPTGLVQHIQWASWGGHQAVGTGIALYEAPNQGVSQGTEERATIVAFNLGICDGERMYQAVEWYFPKHREAFNPHQYENICSGSYQPAN